MRATALAVAIGAALLLLAVVQTGNVERAHVLRGNLVPPVSFVATIPRDRTACQHGELVPSGAGRVRLRIGTFGRPGPPLALTLRGERGPAVVARVGAGWREGDLDITLPRASAGIAPATLCLRNGGAGQIAVAGAVQRPASAAANVRGDAQPGRMAVTYLEDEPRTWWSFTGALGPRLAAARDALPGGAAFAFWAAGSLALCAGAFALLLQVGRRR